MFSLVCENKLLVFGVLYLTSNPTSIIKNSIILTVNLEIKSEIYYPSGCALVLLNQNSKKNVSET